MDPISPISPIGPMSPIAPVLRSCSVHLFLEAAVGKKLLLQPFDVALQEDIFLVDERNGDIGDGLVTSTTYPLPIVSRVEMIAAESACLSAAWVIPAPLLEVAHAEVVFVVE